MSMYDDRKKERKNQVERREVGGGGRGICIKHILTGFRQTGRKDTCEPWKT